VVGPVPGEVQDAVGTQYVLERELGRGGMATVYLAHDVKHGRRVAIKVLHPALADSIGVDRFQREIATLAQLQHPHILAVHDSGETDDHLWFSMPYVEGESLRERLTRETQLPVDEALRITRDIACALEYAHARGIIHRDIKPENILLTTQGDALLADFGIARLPALDAATADALTGTGLVIGTPQYMSPEQANGIRQLDVRSDVFSLGAILYEMLIGEPPFAGPTPRVVVAKMMAGAPLSLRSARPGVPERVDAAVRKALAMTPSDRWPSAAAFAGAVEAPEAVATPAATRARRPVAWRVATMALALVVGAGVVFAWKAISPRSSAALPGAAVGAVRLAVLPFDNVGDSADAYFADGVTDAVRGKLAGLRGLEVIGSASSAQFRHTSKTPREIGHALDAQYLLEGRVRWAKGPDGTNRVRVSAELVDARTSTDKWEQPFDAPLTDVFEVQSDIAGRVAEELEVELTPGAEETLTMQPTADLSAYDAYLRGVAALNAGGPGVQHGEVALFNRAVARDSGFALAWAALAKAQAQQYAFGVPRATLADSADRNSLRALALAPDLAQAHNARADYFVFVHREPVAAAHEDSAALALAPQDVGTLRGMGNVEESLGRWDAAEAHMTDAARLDPQSLQTVDDLAHLELVRRRYDRAAVSLARAVALSPTNLPVIEDNVLLRLGRGDLAGARAYLRALPSSVDRNTLVAFLAEYGDLGWVLDSGDAERLLALRPDAFDGDRGSWACALMQQYAWRGDRRRMRAFADTARVEWEAQLQSAPTDAQRRALLGVTFAYLGQRDAAIEQGERAVALLPIARDGFVGPYVQQQLARIYIILGEPDRALDALEPVLRVPYTISPGWLTIDPNFAPLRGNPRFERLVSGRAARTVAAAL
jgi:eukaryotic-like serine/threonine-protein kinase